MAWRQLPDGSYFNPDTGGLMGVDPKQEARAKVISMRQHGVLPSQKFVQLPSVKGPMQIIEPKRDVLALNPFEMGMGADPAAGTGMSHTAKKVLVVVGVIGVAAIACWAESKAKAKK